MSKFMTINPTMNVRLYVVASTLMVMACALFTAASVLTLLELEPWRVRETHHYWNPGESYSWSFGALKSPDGWWDSRYTHDMERRAWEDRWQIGNRTYRTSDLMGRRI
jgi:hypothetical protein